MPKRKLGRAFELDGVRYVGSPSQKDLPRVKFIDMREIGTGPVVSPDPAPALEALPDSAEGRKTRRGALPVFEPEPAPEVVASEGESTPK